LLPSTHGGWEKSRTEETIGETGRAEGEQRRLESRSRAGRLLREYEDWIENGKAKWE
jgi:hypothetical protein